MIEPTNQELAAQMIGILETLPADLEWFSHSVREGSPRALQIFSEQVLKPWEDLTREAAQRLSEGKP